jgi:DNA-binding IclR family transcriptional regulator
MAGSAPTGRVVDVIELLARPGHEHLRFSDVVRQLGATQATTHAILATLSERGWVSRDPVTKTFSLGPALAAVGIRADLARPMMHAARGAAQRLSSHTGCATSILERIEASRDGSTGGDSLIVACHIGEGGSTPVLDPGDRIPYTPPFGVAFAAWDAEDRQRLWLRRGSDDRELVKRLATILTRTRERGYDVDWITPALAQTARLVVTLQRDGVPTQVTALMDQILLECTTIGFLSDDDPARRSQPVATIAAPAFDHHGEVALIVAAHPLRPLSAQETAAIGREVTAAAQEISVGPARSEASSRRDRGNRRTLV